MRFLLQRVKEARVDVEDSCIAETGKGLLLFAGFSFQDTEELPDSQLWRKMLHKVPEMRIFPDQEGKSNQSLQQIQGDLMLVSQFTLHADCRKGRRPSYTRASSPQTAENLYNRLLVDLKSICPAKVESGIFGAEMDISLCNWGPLTIVLDSEDFI
ncbi:MAG: D-aminoacyl-tRNA deacylase [Thermodesulfobacteriota bacterium]